MTLTNKKILNYLTQIYNANTLDIQNIEEHLEGYKAFMDCTTTAQRIIEEWEMVMSDAEDSILPCGWWAKI